MLPSIFGENLFDEFFNDSFERDMFGMRNALYGKHAKNLMKTDVRESSDGYEVAVDLPGFAKEDINVDLNNGYLTISATKNLNKDEQDGDKRVIRQERYTGSCSRSFYVGDLRPEEIRCKYESGVLTIDMPKADPKRIEAQRRIAIE